MFKSKKGQNQMWGCMNSTPASFPLQEKWSKKMIIWQDWKNPKIWNVINSNQVVFEIENWRLIASYYRTKCHWGNKLRLSFNESCQKRTKYKSIRIKSKRSRLTYWGRKKAVHISRILILLNMHSLQVKWKDFW